jgi:hypothetical protein
MPHVLSSPTLTMQYVQAWKLATSHAAGSTCGRSERKPPHGSFCPWTLYRVLAHLAPNIQLQAQRTRFITCSDDAWTSKLVKRRRTRPTTYSIGRDSSLCSCTSFCICCTSSIHNDQTEIRLMTVLWTYRLLITNFSHSQLCLRSCLSRQNVAPNHVQSSDSGLEPLMC